MMLRRYLPFVLRSLRSVVFLCLVVMALMFVSYVILTYTFAHLEIPLSLRITVLMLLILVPLIILYALALKRRLREVSFVILFLLAAISTISLFMLWDFIAWMSRR